MSGVLALAAALLFARGEFASGLACGWAMTFLDTVDGKLARVTLTSSRIGDVMDHGLDLVHPPFWWWAWGIGLGAGHELATAVVVAGYFVGRALEGAFLAAFGFETHSWRPIDGLFRTITARRNPNLILLSVGTLGGRPDLGLVMVALWTGASLAFHALRLAQALRARARGARAGSLGRGVRRALRCCSRSSLAADCPRARRPPARRRLRGRVLGPHRRVRRGRPVYARVLRDPRGSRRAQRGRARPLDRPDRCPDAVPERPRRGRVRARRRGRAAPDRLDAPRARRRARTASRSTTTSAA